MRPRQGILLLAVACVASTSLAGELEVTRDDFEGTTTIAAGDLSVAIYASFNPVRLYPKPQAVFKDGKLQEFRLQVDHRQMGAKPRYDECSDLKILVDDKPFPLEFVYHHEPIRMDTQETWRAPMTVDQAASLAHAKSVRFRACHDEPRPFDEDDLASLTQWKAAVDSAVSSGKLPPVDD